MIEEIKNLCSNWNDVNEGFVADFAHNDEDDLYEVIVKRSDKLSSKATIPEYRIDVGNAVIGLVLDTLKAQIMLFESYNILV